MTAPAISIIVPCYNGGGYLDALLASIAAQTFRDFELVIIDDGSTEEPTRAKLASLEPNIRVVRQPNRGLAAALSQLTPGLRGLPHAAARMLAVRRKLSAMAVRESWRAALARPRHRMRLKP